MKSIQFPVNNKIVYSLVYAVGAIFLAIIYYSINKNYSIDDSFITYRYADNLKNGFGLVFNVGERYYGTTAAGYAVLLAAVAVFFDALLSNITGALPSVQNYAVGVSCFSLAIICLCFPVIVRAGDAVWRWLLSAAMAGLLFSVSAFNGVPGHETYTFLAMSLVSIVLFEKHLYIASGICLGIAATFRPDAILFAPILLLLDWRRLRVGFWPFVVLYTVRRYIVGLSIILLPWILFVWLYFGQIIPGTMDAKKAQVAMAYWSLYSPIILYKFLIKMETLIIALECLGAFYGAYILVKSKRSGVTLQTQGAFVGVTWLLFGIGSFLFYFSINITFWDWYGVPVLFALVIPGFIFLEVAFDRISLFASGLMSRGFERLTQQVVLYLLLVALTIGVSGNFLQWMRSPEQYWAHSGAYSEIVAFLKEVEPGGTSIQMPEPGSFGYHLGPSYMVIDELGIITPGVAAAFLKGDNDYASNTYNAEYLICGWPGLYSECSKPTLNENFVLIGEYDFNFWESRIGHGARLYRRKDGSRRLPRRP